MKSLKNIAKRTIYILVIGLLLITGLTAASAERVWQAQTDAVNWVENLVSINWGNTPDTYNYDGSNWLLPSQGDLGEPQCVDLITYYTEHLGHRMNGMSAYQYANTVLPEEWIYTSNPQPGDIVIWSGNPGHIGIVTNVDENQFYFVDTNGSNIVYGYTDDGKQINEGARNRGPEAISNATTYIHPHWEPNDAEKHEMQIIETAQEIYDEEGSMYAYINWLANQEAYYRKTLNDANAYNYKLSVFTDYTLAAMSLDAAILTGSPSAMLVSVGSITAQAGINELKRGQSEMTTQEYVYSESCAGIDAIRKAELYDIYDRMENGKFVSAEDAAKFILIYKGNQIALAAGEMGRQYYYDQLNQSTWDYIGSLISSFAPAEAAGRIAGLITHNETIGAGVTASLNLFMDELGIVSECHDNEHITEWHNRIKEITKETENLLKYRGDGGSTVIPTYNIHFDAGEGMVGSTERAYPQGANFSVFPTAYRLGYDFIGWYDTYGNKYTEESIVSANMTLTARWNRIILESGSCGFNLNYVLYSDGLLNISGSGEMTSCPWALNYRNRIGEVILPEGITNIYTAAFEYCKYLHEIYIPESVTTIGSSAFAESGLQSLELPSKLTSLGSNILSGNTGITEITVPGSVTNMFSGVFSGSAIENATFEEGITRIGNYCFAGAKKLKHVHLPSTLQIIEGHAFAETILEELIIPDSVYEYGSEILSLNTTITSLTVSKNIEIGSDTLLGSNVAEVTFPEGATIIPARFCHYAENLSTVNIPESVTTIGDEAFAESGLQNLELPSKLASLGYSILSGNTGITQITVPGSVTNMSCHGYYRCGVFSGSAIENLTFEEGITRIDYYCFAGANKLKKVHLPSTIVNIRENAFLDCLTLSDVHYEGVHNDWEKIAIAEDGNSNLTAATVYCWDGVWQTGTCGESLTWSMEGHTLTITGTGDINDYVYGNAPWYAFRDDVYQIILPDGITRIGEYAFAECGIFDMTLPDSLTVIGNGAFKDCLWLETVEYCDTEENWKKISIGSGNEYLLCAIISYDETEWNITSEIVNGILTISGSGPMPAYEYEDHLEKAYTPWSDRAAEIQKVVVENGVTSIGTWAFAGLENLTSVEIGNGVNRIDTGAFYNCPNLTEITIPDQVQYIEDNAFGRCTGLLNVDLPAGLLKIGSYAFEQCESLTEVVFPSSLRFIRASAFRYCPNLKRITFGTNLKEIGLNAFLESGVQTITISEGAATKVWPVFYDISGKHLYCITMPASLTDLGFCAFYGTALPYVNPDIVTPSGLRTIEAEAMYGTAAVYVWINDNVEFVGDNAFAECLNLKYVYVPSNGITISPNAFPKGTMILGIPGDYDTSSYAEDFANKNGFTFIPLENPYGGNG